MPKEIHPCGPTGGPKNGFRHRNWCWTLNGAHRARLQESSGRRAEAKTQADVATKKQIRRNDKRFKRSQLYKDISETLDSSDHEMITAFRDTMREVHQEMIGRHTEYNAAFEEVVDQFLGHDESGRRNRGSFVSKLQKAEDPAGVKGFDETVQYVRDHAEIQGILQGGISGESGAGSTEEVVFEALKQGKKNVPALNSEEVWDEMLSMLGSHGDVGQYEKTKEEPVPFAQDLKMGATFTKEIVRPGTYKIEGKEREITVGDIKKWHKSVTALRANGNDIPVPYNHSEDAVPILTGEVPDATYNNSGWLLSTQVKPDGSMHGVFEASTEQDEENFRTNKVKNVSLMMLPEFEDGHGNKYEQCITHVAACVHPVMPGQSPFVPTDGALALSLAMAYDNEPQKSGSQESNSIESLVSLLSEYNLELGPDVTPENLVDRLCTSLRTALAQKNEMEGGGLGQTVKPEGSKVQQPAPIAMSHKTLSEFIAANPTNSEGKTWSDASEIDNAFEAQKPVPMATDVETKYQLALKKSIMQEIDTEVKELRMKQKTADRATNVLARGTVHLDDNGEIDREHESLAPVFDALAMSQAAKKGNALHGENVDEVETLRLSVGWTTEERPSDFKAAAGSMDFSDETLNSFADDMLKDVKPELKRA